MAIIADLVMATTAAAGMVAIAVPLMTTIPAKVIVIRFPSFCDRYSIGADGIVERAAYGSHETTPIQYP